MLNVGQRVSELRRMTVGEQTRSYHKEFLVRRFARRILARSESGGLRPR